MSDLVTAEVEKIITAEKLTQVWIDRVKSIDMWLELAVMRMSAI
jgi:hypothetical protein